MSRILLAGSFLAVAAFMVVCEWLFKNVFPIAVVVLLFVWLMPTDPTDHSPFHRSNMSIRTDCSTGVEYLESADGYLTPRLDEQGQRITRSCADMP